jgi:hypothetical protein
MDEAQGRRERKRWVEELWMLSCKGKKRRAGLKV